MSRFAAGLRTAIEASTLSLEELAAELREQGTPVSTSSLSAWQSGLSVPRRAGSLVALGKLEAVLGLVPGALAGLLPAGGRRRKAELTADDAWENPGAVARVLSRLNAVLDDPTDPEKLSHRLTLRMNEHGHMQSLTLATLALVAAAAALGFAALRAIAALLLLLLILLAALLAAATVRIVVLLPIAAARLLTLLLVRAGRTALAPLRLFVAARVVVTVAFVRHALLLAHFWNPHLSGGEFEERGDDTADAGRNDRTVVGQGRPSAPCAR